MFLFSIVFPSVKCAHLRQRICIQKDGYNIFLLILSMYKDPYMHKKNFTKYNKKGQIEYVIFFLEKGPIVIIKSEMFEKLRRPREFWKIPN